MSTRKRNILTAAQKRELCETKEREPHLSFFSLISEIEEEEKELGRLIALLPKGDLNAKEYIYIEDEMEEGGLTDEEIIDAVLNANKEEENVVDDETDLTPVLEKVSPAEADKSIDKIMRFLYEQELEFGEVNEELRILKKLHKRVKLQVVNNLKQVNLHHFNITQV